MHGLDNVSNVFMYSYTFCDNNVRELVAVKSATHLIAEYHRVRLQSTPLGKLCTDASA